VGRLGTIRMWEGMWGDGKGVHGTSLKGERMIWRGKEVRNNHDMGGTVRRCGVERR